MASFDKGDKTEHKKYIFNAVIILKVLDEELICMVYIVAGNITEDKGAQIISHYITRHI